MNVFFILKIKEGNIFANVNNEKQLTEQKRDSPPS